MESGIRDGTMACFQSGAWEICHVFLEPWEEGGSFRSLDGILVSLVSFFSDGGRDSRCWLLLLGYN
jgi:hypothetical protein